MYSEFCAAFSGRNIKLINLYAASSFFTVLGITILSNHKLVPSFGIA